MKKIIAFSKYIFYNVGGAEKSMIEYLKKDDFSSCDITLLGVDNLKSFNSKKYAFSNLNGWGKVAFKLKFQSNKFSYLEYWLNRAAIIRFFKKVDLTSELYTYGFFAPLAAIGFSGKTTVFLRSETDLGINANYHTGLKRILKFIHIFLEYPFYLVYLLDLKSCYQKSNLVFNSKWMASECKKKFGVDGSIEYPIIDTDSLKNNYLSNNQNNSRGIVFIGDSELKGISIVKKIAKLLNTQEFYIFSRHVNHEVKIENIRYMPWSSDSSIPYTFAKLLIVPSVWHEAFGRVSVEAQTLDIPVLVSQRGGLPETVEYNKKFIVEKYLDPREWVSKINDLLVK